MRGQLQFDRTGVFGGDLIVTTTAGHLWRVTSAGEATMPRDPGRRRLRGADRRPERSGSVRTVGGKILVGDEDIDAIYAVDAAGRGDDVPRSASVPRTS